MSIVIESLECPRQLLQLLIKGIPELRSKLAWYVETVETYVSYPSAFKSVFPNPDLCKVRLLGYSCIKSENTTVSVLPSFKLLEFACVGIFSS